MKNYFLYSDGACSGNPGPGGWGFILYDGFHHRVYEGGGGEPSTTNNRMEMTACLQGLQRIAKQATHLDHIKQKLENVCHIHIYTDSTYLIYGATQWMQGWKFRGWKNSKGEEIQNPDLWRQMDQVLAELRHEPHLYIHWHYVPGHEGIDGNERCDVIAVAYSKNDYVDLYEGDVKNYRFDIATPPPDFPIPEMKFDRGGGEKKENAFYLSSVGGIVYRHSTWPDCERRVKGVAQAKFKKLKSENEIASILQGWGLSSDVKIN